MSSRRTTSVWIACFAVLFSLLAMPLAPTAQRGTDSVLLWGGFCGASAGLAAVALAEQGTQQQDKHTAMLHCVCASASVVVLLPAGLPAGLFAWQPPAWFSSGQTHRPASPRQQWPAANPRASPAV